MHLIKYGFLILLWIFLLSGPQLSSAQEQTFFGDTVLVELTPKQREEFVASIKQKLFFLQHYISKISDKTVDLEERMEMIESAVKLFSDENNIIQIANSRTGEITQLPVRQYFRRLAYINASRVDITFYKGIRLETLKRGSDGYYYGTALIFQETIIYRQSDAASIYKDKTIKQVNFKCKQEQYKFGDVKEDVVEILLENINVKETSTI
jgi:hypothetical protein